MILVSVLVLILTCVFGPFFSSRVNRAKIKQLFVFVQIDGTVLYWNFYQPSYIIGKKNQFNHENSLDKAI